MTYHIFMDESHITIKEIAKEAHVGIGTVSRALNNSPNISDVTKAKIQAVIKAHNYKPNAPAAHLARKTISARYVGLIVRNFRIRFFYEVFESIHAALKKHHIRLLILEYSENAGTFFSQIMELNLSGLIFFTMRPNRKDTAAMRSRNIPFILIDSSLPHTYSITNDNYYGGKLAAEYLLRNGSQAPCYVHSKKSNQLDTLRYTGFRDGLKTALHTDGGTYAAALDENAGYKTGKKILSDRTADGVFCFSDEIAIGVLKAVRDAGSELPVIGYDGTRDTEGWGLSTISQNPYIIGKKAAAHIAALIAGSTPEQTAPLVLTPVLIDRGS
ncbi:MAG: LacI family transcriptional regulator [Treponema sp.]|jgi:LacI family transcriptional regulator|nr:LacI family transcriptional regulator [Treponema sp.]